MTSHLAAASPISRKSPPALTAALAVLGLAAGTLAGAWYFQLVVGLPPCPLCLEERIAYHVVIPLALAAIAGFGLLTRKAAA